MATAVTGPAPDLTVTAEDISHRLDGLPFLPFHFKIITILGFGTFFDAFDVLSMSTAMTMIVASFKLDFGQGGALLSAAAGGQFVGAILFGYGAEHIGRKWSFVISIGLFGLCSVGSALALDVNQIVWARAIQGFGLGGATPVAAALFTEFVRGRTRGLFTLLYETMFVWGLFFAPLGALLCLALFGPTIGWRALFALGGLPVIGAVIAAFKLPESPRWLASKGRLTEANATVRRMEDEARRLGKPSSPSTKPLVRPERTRFTELFRGMYLRRTFVAWSMEFGAYFIANGFLAWSPTLYMKIGGLPANRAIMLQVVSTVLTLIICYVTAFTVDHIGRVKWFVIGFACSSIGAALGVVVTGPLGFQTWPVLLGCGIIVQLGAATAADVIGLYLSELYPTRIRAWATGAGSSFNRAGSFIAPLLLGWILSETNSLAWFFGAFLVVAIYSMVVVLMLGVETKRRALEELSP